MKRFFDMQFVIIIYVGIAFMIIPYFLNLDYLPNGLISQLGVLVIIIGFFMFYNRRNLYNFKNLDKNINTSLNNFFDYTKSLNDKIVKLENAGIKNFQIIKSTEFKEIIREFIYLIRYDSDIKIVVDFEHINENTLLLFDNLTQEQSIQKISILITGENEITEINLNNLSELSTKQAFLLNLINRLSLKFSEKIEIRFIKKSNSINLIITSNIIAQLINIAEDSQYSLWILYSDYSHSYKELSNFYFSSWENANQFHLK